MGARCVCHSVSTSVTSLTNTTERPPWWLLVTAAAALCVRIITSHRWSLSHDVGRLSRMRISIVPLNSKPGLNPKPVIGRGRCNEGHVPAPRGSQQRSVRNCKHGQKVGGIRSVLSQYCKVATCVECTDGSVRHYESCQWRHSFGICAEQCGRTVIIFVCLAQVSCYYNNTTS